jgi:hypothetical protein
LELQREAGFDPESILKTMYDMIGHPQQVEAPRIIHSISGESLL